MPPAVYYHSNYYTNGFSSQYFDGRSMTPHYARLVTLPSNVVSEATQFFEESKPFSPSFGVSYLDTSIPVADTLRRSVVYELNVTANEIALGYFIKTGDIKTIDDIDRVMILVPRAQTMYRSGRFPLIGGSFTTTSRTNTLNSSLTLDVISEVGSYDFPIGSSVGFVAFARCWSETDGLVIDWSKAFWTEPQLNPDGMLPHFATYIRNPIDLLPVTTVIRAFGLEDTRIDWGSDKDYNDFFFTLVSDPHTFPLTDVKDVGESYLQFGGDIALDATGLYAYVGIPEDNKNEGSVCIYKRTSVLLRDWTLVQKLPGHASSTLFGYVLVVTPDRSTLVVSCQSQYGFGTFHIYKLNMSNQYDEIETFVGDWGLAHLGYVLGISDDGLNIVAGVENSTTNVCARLYHNTVGSWAVKQDLTIPIECDLTTKTGFSLCYSGDSKTLVIGSNMDTLKNGCVWFYNYNGTTFDAPINISVAFTSANAEFGRAVSINRDGSVLAVSKPSNFSADGSLTCILTRTSLTEFKETKTITYAPLSVPYLGKLTTGYALKMNPLDHTITSAGVFRFNSNEFVRALFISKLQPSGEWILVQNPLIEGLETGDAFRSPKFALSDDGKCMIGRDIRMNDMTVGDLVTF